MTSSIFSALKALEEASPKVHLIASITLLFPQPLGPKRAVIPSANSTFTRSGKDLNPNISRLLRNTNFPHKLT